MLRAIILTILLVTSAPSMANAFSPIDIIRYLVPAMTVLGGGKPIIGLNEGTPSCCCLVSPCKCPTMEELMAERILTTTTPNYTGQPISLGNGQPTNTPMVQAQQIKEEQTRQENQTNQLSASDKDKVEVKQATQTNLNEAIEEATSEGICNKANNLAEASTCLLKAVWGSMPEKDQALLFAAATEDKEAQAIIYKYSPNLANFYATDKEQATISEAGDIDEEAAMNRIMEKYGTHKSMIENGALAVSNLKQINTELKENGLTQKTIPLLKDYVRYKKEMLNAAKSSDLLNEARATAMENDAIKAIVNLEGKVSKKIADAGRKLTSTGIGGHLGTVLTKTGNNLIRLGEGSAYDKAEALIDMENKVLELAEGLHNETQKAQTEEPAEPAENGIASQNNTKATVKNLVAGVAGLIFSGLGVAVAKKMSNA